ncbi:MAG: hypothetical protein KatS3mg083_269 [Candidatus Dojkabacteria bacterium]|nr:MAG: hypothetical protein KatS3mg083_269 [Candidatus Dojkabacteria bacterium]
MNLKDFLSRYVYVNTESRLFNETFGGIHLGTYYVIAAPPKAGKTTFIDSLFVVPYLYKFVETPKRIRFIYFNLELDNSIKLVNLALAYVNRKLKTDYTFPDLLRIYSNDIRSEEEEDLLKKIDKALDWLAKKIESGVLILRDRIELSELRQLCIEEFESNPDAHHIVIIDHMRRVDVPYFDGMKSKVDALSSEIVSLRNKYSQTFVGVIHTNRNFSFRNLGKNSMPIPLPEDIKDTGNLSEDADYVFTYSNPHAFKLAKPDLTVEGIHVDSLPENVRYIALVESRYSESPKYMLTCIDNTKLMVLNGLEGTNVNGSSSNEQSKATYHVSQNGSFGYVIEEVPDNFWPGEN